VRIERRGDLSLRLLEVFGALMREQTTVRAAEALGVSQPAVSSALAALEAQLGFTLFERRNRRLVPTQEAMSLHREVEPVFAMLASVEGRVRDLRAGAAGKLRIVATPPIGHTVAPIALRRFLRERPEVVIDYDVRRAEAVVEAVAFGSADIGMALGCEPAPGLSVEVVDEAEMVAVLPRDHPLAAAPWIGPAEAARAGFVGLHAGSRLGQILREAFRAAGAPYSPRVESRYCHTALVLADAGLGVAIVDRFTARFLLRPSLVALPFLPAVSAACCLLTRADAPASRLADSFAAELRQAVREA
jgi:DNA-binding transcriptional LysR family regulator